MAKPPEPIEDVLPAADTGVLAEVLRIVEAAPQPQYAPTQATDVPSVAARQVVELKVSAVLFGRGLVEGAVVKAVKPAGDYALRAGNRGPFLLSAGEAGLQILGRYGPDTWREDTVRRAAVALGKR